VRERAVRLGKSAALIGVLTEPSQRADAGRPAVVFLNSGILHHVGACRLHVRLARRLAAAGFASLRFDLSGIGDSEARKDSLTFQQSAMLEVREAMDHVASLTGAREFVLIGLCSGADMGFHVSQEDARVVGLVQLDAFAYRTTGYYIHHYAPKLFSPAAWSRVVQRKLGRLQAYSKGPAPGEDYVQPEYRRVFPPREHVAAGLRALVARGVHLLNLFSGGQPDHYNHAGQYVRSFPDVAFQGRIRVEYFPGADHLFSGLEHQRRVDDVITAWIEGLPGSAAPAAAEEPVAVAAPKAVAASAAFRVQA
jgi:hypothetical protein